MLDLACRGSSFAPAGAEDIVSNPQPGADAPGYYLTPPPPLGRAFQQPPGVGVRPDPWHGRLAHVSTGETPVPLCLRHMTRDTTLVHTSLS